MHRGTGVQSRYGRSPAPLLWAFRSTRSRRGATLVETVAAIGLLAIAMNVLGHFMLEAIHGSVLAGRRVQALLLAQEQMECLLASRSDLAGWQKRAEAAHPLDSESGKRTFPGEGMEAYQLEWEILEPAKHPGMKEAVVRTYWRNPHGRVEWIVSELRTLVAVPGTK